MKFIWQIVEPAISSVENIFQVSARQLGRNSGTLTWL